MKVFKFKYYERWGAGQGIIIAETKEIAIKIMIAPYLPEPLEEIFPKLELKEIDISTPCVLDFSWSE